jgi:glutathionylspermidine synthase
MERLDVTPRPNWREDCEAVGFTYHSMDGVYWDEAHCYRFSAAQIDELEAATAALHELTLTAIEQIVTTDRFEKLAIPAAFADYVKAS